MLICRGFILKPTERRYILLKKALFQVALRLRDRHILSRQSLEILNIIFITLPLKQVSVKFSFKNWRTAFYLNVLRLRTQHFHTKLPSQKPMFRQIEWEVQNGPIAKNTVLPLTDFLIFFCLV